MHLVITCIPKYFRKLPKDGLFRAWVWQNEQIIRDVTTDKMQHVIMYMQQIVSIINVVFGMIWECGFTKQLCNTFEIYWCFTLAYAKGIRVSCLWMERGISSWSNYATAASWQQTKITTLLTRFLHTKIVERPISQAYKQFKCVTERLKIDCGYILYREAGRQSYISILDIIRQLSCN